MRFLRPEWLHLLWLAAPIVAFHLVRRRTRPREVSSLLLWEQVLSRALRRPLWGRLREAFALLLNLLLLAGLALAAASPERVVAAPRTETWAVVISADASMRALVPEDGAGGEPGRTRFDVARDTARAVLSRLAGGDRSVIVLAGESPTLISDLAAAAAGPGAADLPAALAFAATAAGGTPDRTIVIGDRDPEAPRATFLSVATEAAPNAGFTEVGVRRDPVRLTTTVTARVAAAGPGEARREAVLRGPGGHEARRSVVVPAGAELEVAFTFTPLAEGRAEIVLLPGDAFPTDDRVAVPVAPPPRLRLLVAGTPSPFLESALLAMGDRVDRARSAVVDLDDPQVLEAWNGEIPDDAVLVLVGRDVPAGIRAGRIWVLADPTGPEREAPAITSWASDHPILAELDLGNLGLRRGRPVPAAEGETSLLSVEGGAAMVATETKDFRVLRVRFALADSNLPVLAAFPLLVRNVLAWFAGVEDRRWPAAIRLDQPLEPMRRLPDGIDRVFLSGPAVPAPVEVPVRDGRIAWRPSGAEAKAGALVVRAGARSETVAVNPVARTVRSLPGAASGGRLEDLPRRLLPPDAARDLRPWILGGLAVLLLFEWWVWQRGRRHDRRVQFG